MLANFAVCLTRLVPISHSISESASVTIELVFWTLLLFLIYGFLNLGWDWDFDLCGFFLDLLIRIFVYIRGIWLRFRWLWALLFLFFPKIVKIFIVGFLFCPPAVRLDLLDLLFFNLERGWLRVSWRLLRHAYAYLNEDILKIIAFWVVRDT